MHVIANVTGKLFSLQYKLIFEAGLLKLIKFKPLYEEKKEAMIDEIKEEPSVKLKESFFNVYN
jgi:hypothetical protein